MEDWKVMAVTVLTSEAGDIGKHLDRHAEPGEVHQGITIAQEEATETVILNRERPVPAMIGE